MNKKASEGIQLFLEGLGIDAKEAGLEKTPERVAKFYEELFSGYKKETKDVWGEVFPTDYEGLVSVTEIPFYSICEHHLMPFFGTVDIVYQPHEGRVAGLSKLGKLVDFLAKQPQLQERLTKQLVEAIETDLQAEGVIVRLKGTHLCMLMQGEMQLGTQVVTLKSSGVLEKEGSKRQEALTIIKGDSADV